jgi:Holliday junction resolvase RusA-like endonuclease
MYWILDTGDVSLLRESSVEEADSNSLHSGVVTLLRFKVGGSPRPLQRHRTSRGFTYNPSASAQQSFREVVEKVVFGGSTHNDGEIPVNGDSSPQRHSPLWGSEHALAMSVVFRMKRPIVHFKSGRPGPGRLRDSAPAALGTASVGTDVDNLAKFVLDSLNGLIYADDRQIVSLQVSKVYDCVDECRGSTEVSIRLLKQEDEDFVTKL